VKPKEVISKLYAAHNEGKTNMGFDIDGDSGEIKVGMAVRDVKMHHLLSPQDCLESEVFDLLLAKKWALKYATNAACTILRVDQIIMAKRAGGPKPRDTQGQDQDDD
jgi:T-complex protein 1 subunit theta